MHIETVYQFTDHINYSGLVHYRLKMVDKDGSAEYSAVVTVALNTIENSVKIYPTMVEGSTIYVETAGNLAQGKVEIVDMNGRIMLSQKHVMNGRQQISLGNSRLAAGSYMVRVTDGAKVIAGKMVMVR